MKRTSLAVPAVAVLLVAGCSGEGRRTPAAPAAVASSPTPERLTLQVAAREFHKFVNNDDVSRAGGDERLALNWVSDGQVSLTAAEYRKAVYLGDPVPRYTYAAPTLYVPKLSDTTYPQWFVAVAERTVRPVEGEEPDKDAKDSERTSIMAFARRSPESPWRLSVGTLLAPKAKSPRIAVDPEGYAKALTVDESSLLIKPKSVAGIQAAIAEEGPESVPADLMKPGPGTTGYFTETRQIRKQAGKESLAYDVVFPPPLYPVFPLATEDGGALVLYALGRDAVTLAKGERDRPPIPHDAAHLLDTLILGREVRVTSMLQFAAYVPVKVKGDKVQPKADVVGIDGAVTRADAPEKVP
ncbi:hypothetical protein [Thermomonospora umbrina]|uniref:DUF8094 domain-containing protein n=1 Tax=Thermomonospora umbrina TaxID=111806 RepID=A0A3D9SRQ3_9ACTN|nr:hypothetical protein [Thermomonospora umbrina]REE98498.1 hypothetical protein DFJ69_3987 [Thermomonospora umbrina]